MGNVMCCCKGREKTIDDGKSDDSGIPTLSKSSMRNKTPIGDEYLESMGNIIEPSMEPQNTKPANANFINTANSENQTISTRHISNFSTFGGDHLNVMDEDNLAYQKPSKTKQPIKNKTIVESKTENVNYLLRPSPNKNIFIRIQIEALEITYKFCEDFGLQIKPYIELGLENQEKIKILPNQDVGDLDKSLNASNVSVLMESDNSFNNLNVSQNMRGNSFIMSSGKDKFYPLKFAKCFEIPQQNYYSNITFSLKNDLNVPNNKVLPPLVIMGETKIPINLLYNNYKENCFDGNLEIKLRNNTLVAYLKVSISVSDKSLVGQDEFFEKLQKAKLLDMIEEDNLKNNRDNISGQSLKNQMNVWDKELVDFEDINLTSLQKYFSNDNLQMDLKFASKIPKINSSDTREIYKLYSECINSGNLVGLYQILILFVKMTNKNDLKITSEFMRILNEEEKSTFIDLPKNCNENAYIMKQYIIFMYNYMRYFRNNKSITIRNNKDIEDPIIIKSAVDVINKSMERLKINNNTPEYIQEIKDCIIWALNLLNELISQPNEIMKLNKDETIEHNKKEHTNIYLNCIQIISGRIYILRIIDSFIGDSQIVGSIFRLFRKTIQVLTNYSTNNLDMKKLEIQPKEFAAKFKKLIIEQNDGIYFTTLKIMLMKYQHYTELHVNVLIIIYQLTNYCDTPSLIWAAEKLNLAVFRDVFEPYRGKLRNFNKMMNNLHLNVLSNFSEIVKISQNDTYEDLLKLIGSDLKSYYRINKNYERRLTEFRNRKKVEIEIHDLITRIGANVTTNPNVCKLLMDSYFFDDIIEYLIIIGIGEVNDNESVNSNNNNNSADFILKLKEKKKKMNLEEIKKIVCSVVENSIIVIINIMNAPDDISDPFSTKMAEHEIGTADDLFELVGECRNLLVKYGVKVDKIDEYFDTLKLLFE